MKRVLNDNNVPIQSAMQVFSTDIEEIIGVFTAGEGIRHATMFIQKL